MNIFGKLKQNIGVAEGEKRKKILQKKLKNVQKIIDLGCGNNPIEGACVGVDLYVAPKERSLGTGPVIDVEKMKAKGVDFVNTRIDGSLPFKDKEFDFAYSHHVFEHLDHPEIACREMMRIAKEGVIITPSVCAEFIFGRPYHQWLVMERTEKIIFFRKRPFEDTPFGQTPKWDEGKKNWVADEHTSPFDMLLNDENWYHGEEGEMPKLTKILRQHYYAHSPLFEVVFFWQENFQWEVIK